jgi:hypothetical protein
MANEAEKEMIVPSGGFNFLSEQHLEGMSQQDIECQAAENGDDLRSVILPGPVHLSNHRQRTKITYKISSDLSKSNICRSRD